MHIRSTGPTTLFALLLTLALVMPALPGAAVEPEEQDAPALSDLDLDPGSWVQQRSSRSRSRSRSRTQPLRFNMSIGGGLNIGNQWMDYTVESVYQVPKNGLVEDSELRNFYFITKPVLDIQVGLEVAQERLVIGFHFALSGMSQRANASMIAEWENGTETVLDQSGETVYAPPLALLGLGAAYVIGPDRMFSPMVGLRFGIGVTWDADYHMIDAWKSWYNDGEINMDEALSFRSRVPVRGGLDLGLRWNAHEKFGVELHIPVEMFGMHGYLRGVITGANARFVLRL